MTGKRALASSSRVHLRTSTSEQCAISIPPFPSTECARARRDHRNQFTSWQSHELFAVAVKHFQTIQHSTGGMRNGYFIFWFALSSFCLFFISFSTSWIRSFFFRRLLAGFVFRKCDLFWTDSMQKWKGKSNDSNKNPFKSVGKSEQKT